MNLVKTTLGIGKTIRNAARLKEIISVFAKNGFQEFIIKAKLHDYIPNFVFPNIKKDLSDPQLAQQFEHWSGSLGYRLRLSFEELGPAFVKFGQLLGTREDYFHESFISEMKKLQDEVKGISAELAKEVIEKSLGKKIDDIFLEFAATPLASASIASVFNAKLINGEEVVVKIKRPGIELVIENDFQLLSFIVDQFEKSSDDFKFLGISRNLEDFYRSIKLEMNFIVERYNLERLSQNNFKKDNGNILVFPKSYAEFCTKDILVMDFLQGIPFSKLKPSQVTKELEENLLKCVQIFMQSLLHDGFFHADLHGGNFFLLKDNRIGIVDFGLVGILSVKNRTIFLSILYHLVSGDFEGLVFELLDVADFEQIPNYKQLSRDLELALTPYLGLNVSQINSVELLKVLVKILAQHKIYLPREWLIIFRALMTLDGVGKSLGLDLNTFDLLDKNTSDLMSKMVSKDKLIESSLWLTKDLLNSARLLPKHLGWFLKEFSKRNYSLELRHPAIEKKIDGVVGGLNFLATSVIGCSLMFAGLHFINNRSIISFSDIPGMTLFFWTGAILCMVWGMKNIKK